MSLDVSLINPTPVTTKGTGIFVRDNGSNRELSLEEARYKYPDFKIEEVEKTSYEVFDSNITHNLNKMADAAGIYEYLWRPDEINVVFAKELIDPLREGLHKLKSNPDLYKQYNPANGWGTYEQLVNFVQDYLDACYKYPDSKIEVCR